MIAVFARANHPQQGWDFSHGYVVVGVRCGFLDELRRVREHVARVGLRLPDRYRVQHLGPAAIDWSQHEWYGGGPASFDYLGTFEGDIIDGIGPPNGGMSGSKGDNRFFWIYDAPEVLA